MLITLRPGVSMPAVTTRLDRTKQDMRKGRRTGSPVSENSGVSPCHAPPHTHAIYIPGCSVESTIFLACHSSGVISFV